MDWLLHLGEPETHKPNFKKLDKFTLYDHNYISEINEKDQTFTCTLNCKRINRVYSTICQIDGDLKIGLINISCRLLDQDHVVHGQWEYQKIQLTRFAFRYNERSYRNIYIRTNPFNGDITVNLSFMTTIAIIEDDQKFRQIVTDLCHIVGQQSEMIFNTMLEIIFGKEANQPYLKSAIKVNLGFPRYMKVQKLLDKIKSLIATSSFYKIRSNISSAHKNRSYFKKFYLNNDKKLISNPKIMQMALAYEIKFSKKYEETEKKRPTQFIKDYIELQQKNEIEFAKHLSEGIQNEFTDASINREQISDVRYKQNGGSIYYLIYNNQQVEATAHKYPADKIKDFQHEIEILQAIGRRHPNMFQAYVPKNPQPEIASWIFYRYEQEMSIVDFLRKNKKTISLSTKLHIMSQICAFLQYLHKLNIGYFIHIDNIFITKNIEIKIRGFSRAYTTEAWVQNKKDQKSKCSKFILPPHELISFPYRCIDKNDLNNQKCDVMSLGVCLYKILMQKLPFQEKKLYNMCREIQKEEWFGYWVVETEYFLSKGGQLVKIIGHLLLKCFEIQNLFNRPYVQWLQVILCQIRTSLNGLY